MGSRRTILLVEDDPSDVLLLQMMFKRAALRPPHVVSTGEAAISYLEGKGEFNDRKLHPIPALVLLDLKLPHIPGLDVLKWIREQPNLRRIIVVVLTSSHLNVDIERAYSLGANSYLVKPPNLELLSELVKQVKDYWLTQNQFPAVNLPHS